MKQMFKNDKLEVLNQLAETIKENEIRARPWYQKAVPQMLIITVLIATDAATTYMVFSSFMTSSWQLVLLTTIMTAAMLEFLPYFSAISLSELIYKTNELDDAKRLMNKCLAAVTLIAFFVLFLIISVLTITTRSSLFTIAGLEFNEVDGATMMWTAVLLSFLRFCTSVVAFFLSLASDVSSKLRTQKKLFTLRMTAIEIKIECMKEEAQNIRSAFLKEREKSKLLIAKTFNEAIGAGAKTLFRQDLAKRMSTPEATGTVTDENKVIAKDAIKQVQAAQMDYVPVIHNSQETLKTMDKTSTSK